MATDRQASKSPLLATVLVDLLGCGPSLPTSDDELGDESSSDGSTGGESSNDESSSDESSGGDDSSDDGESTGDESSDGETTGDDESSDDETTGDDDSSDETTGDDECPTVIGGTLEINDETDLETLACLVHAQWIYVTGSFADLSFLSSLEQVEALHIRDTPLLVDLTGLDSLQSVSALWIVDAPSLVDLSGLPTDVDMYRLHVGGDVTSLTSIAMPANGAHYVSFGGWQRPNLELLMTASPTPLRIEVSGAPLLADLDDIAQCCLDQQAGLRLRLSDTPLLSDLQGLEPFTELQAFALNENPEVASLAGLQNLEIIDSLELSNGCDPIPGAKLANLGGLEQLVEIGSLRISAQGGLVSLAGLPSEIAVGYATVTKNPLLDQALIDEWFAAAMPDSHDSCDNLNGPPCLGICPQ